MNLYEVKLGNAMASVDGLLVRAESISKAETKSLQYIHENLQPHMQDKIVICAIMIIPGIFIN